MLGFRSQERWVFITFAASILFLSYVVDRSQFSHVILGYSLAFYSYYYWIEKKRFSKLKDIIQHAVVIRLLMLFALPQLSDDYFRFIWDGLIQLQGINPYSTLPSALVDTSEYMKDLYEKMNSPSYYSVYPPVLQWIWHGSSLLVGENSLWQIVCMRGVIILADVGVLVIGDKILRMMKRKSYPLALYALNPLVIVELTGNLHFEGLMLCFTLLGVYLLMWMKQKDKLGLLFGAVVAIALGVLTKLVLLLSVPAMWRRWGPMKTILTGTLVILVVALGFLPFVNEELMLNFSQSLDLYFRNFQFNSSIFNLTTYVSSFWIPHYTVEIVGPYITLVMVVAILAIAFLRKAGTYERYFETLLFILSIHLLFASTVHPWYIVNLVGVAMFTRYRYPMVWSFAAVLSYFMYSNDLIEVWWILGIEYLLVVSYAIVEIQKARSRVA